MSSRTIAITGPLGTKLYDTACFSQPHVGKGKGALDQASVLGTTDAGGGSSGRGEMWVSELRVKGNFLVTEVGALGNLIERCSFPDSPRLPGSTPRKTPIPSPAKKIVTPMLKRITPRRGQPTTNGGYLRSLVLSFSGPCLRAMTNSKLGFQKPVTDTDDRYLPPSLASCYKTERKLRNHLKNTM